jgi:hypothetical protein
MRPLFILLFCLVFSPAAQAWNAAGHRLTAIIAWQDMPPAAREFVAKALEQHPDYPRWREKSGTGEAMLVFAEATTWPDSIRNDPRFYDERRESPTPDITGLPDNARHLDWHYADLEPDGQRGRGQIDRQIGKLTELLRSTAKPGEIAWALPWLAHLVADLHQPLHVGYSADRGGNTLLIENPFDAKNPFVKLHAYWDGLPGPSSLRGKKLRKQAGLLMAEHPASVQGGVALWLSESRALLPDVYPKSAGSVSLIIDQTYREQAKARADQRITEAGRRLGQLLESIQRSRVSRGTR